MDNNPSLKSLGVSLVFVNLANRDQSALFSANGVGFKLIYLNQNPNPYYEVSFKSSLCNSTCTTGPLSYEALMILAGPSTHFFRGGNGVGAGRYDGFTGYW